MPSGIWVVTLRSRAASWSDDSAHTPLRETRQTKLRSIDKDLLFYRDKRTNQALEQAHAQWERGWPWYRLFLPIFSRQVTPIRRVLQQQRLRGNATDCRMGMGEAWVRTQVQQKLLRSSRKLERLQLVP